MDQCPYCGSKTGLFSRETVTFDQYYKFNGEPNGFSDMSKITRRKTTPLYCSHCKKKVTTLEELEIQKEKIGGHLNE